MANSNASSLLSASEERGSIVVSTRSWANRIQCLGASIPTSFLPGNISTSFMMAPDGPGVVAVSVEGSLRSDSRSIQWHDFFLPVQEKDGGGYVINLNDSFVPQDGRVGQIIDNAWVMVRIGNEFFSNEPNGRRPESVQYVSDPNLLCRYLVGMATADEVKVADLSRQSRIFEAACHRHAHAEWMSLREHFHIDGPESVSQYVIAAYGVLQGQLEVLQCDLAGERDLRAKDKVRLECLYMESMREIATVHGTLSRAIPTANPCLISDGVDGLSKLVNMAVEEITALRQTLTSVAAEADTVWFGLREIRGIVDSARKRGLLPSK